MGHRRLAHSRYPAPPALEGVCSVWTGNGYDYYDAPGLGGVGAAWSNPVGTPLDEALPRLPFSARRVGSGAAARGTVATSGSRGLGDLFGFSTRQIVTAALVIGGILYITHRKAS